MLSGADEEDAGGCEDDSVDASEGGAGHEERHQPRHHAHRPRGESLQGARNVADLFDSASDLLNYHRAGPESVPKDAIIFEVEMANYSRNKIQKAWGPLLILPLYTL